LATPASRRSATWMTSSVALSAPAPTRIATELGCFSRSKRVAPLGNQQYRQQALGR
jgi:hypothetical protein